MGEIFSAHDEKLNRTVAVKRIAQSLLHSDRSRGQFLREARAAAALSHPFICTVHEVLEHEGTLLIVMERVQGETLLSRLQRGPLPADEITARAKEIAEALAAAHQQGIVHRDIKSGNIMVTSSGHVKVMDFGLALIDPSPEEATARLSQRSTPAIAGTLPYIAPEVLRGHQASPASDVYALGVVLYEMATGRRPFSGTTDALLVSAILDGKPLSPRQWNGTLSTELSGLILSMLSQNPAERPTAAAVIERLRTRARLERVRTSARWPCCHSAL